MSLPFIDTSLRVCAEFISIWIPEVGKSSSNVTVILTLSLISDSNHFIRVSRNIERSYIGNLCICTYVEGELHENNSFQVYKKLKFQ